MEITEEQRKQINANRLKALEIRRRKEQEKLGAQQQNASNSARPNGAGGLGFGLSTSCPQQPSSSNGFAPKAYFLNNKTNPSSVSGNHGFNLPMPRPPIAQQKSVAPVFQSVKMKCCLVSRDRFEARSDYNKELIDIFKTMDTRIYDGVSKTWSFRLIEYDKLLSKARDKFQSAIDIIPLPEWIRKIFAKGFRGETSSNSVPEIDLSLIDPFLTKKIFPFQRDGIRFVISRNGRALLADDMGLGKTVQAIGVAAYYKDDWPLLVVCPSSMRYTWSTDLVSWLPSQVSEENIFVVNSAKDSLLSLSNKRSVIITSYDMMVSLEKDFVSRKFGIVILDESHLVKTWDSKRTKSAQKVCKAAKRLILLTGTPSPSRPRELYSQISLIRRDIFSSFFLFAIRYCDGKKNVFGGIDANGATFMEELQVLLKETVMIRRVKSEVLKELPDKLRHMVILDKSSVKTNLNEMKDAKKEFEEQVENDGDKKHGALLKFFSETARAKMEAVTKYVVEALESTEEKLIIFAHHRIVMDSLDTAIHKAKVQSIRIDGETSSIKRTEYVDKFQNNPEIRVALLSIMAANTGLTLTAACTVIFAELSWNPGTLVQAEDRAYRVGQRNTVVAKYLVATGTADDHLWLMINKKLNVLHQVGLSKDNFQNSETTVIRDTPEGSGTTASRTKRNNNGCILSFLEQVAASEDDTTETNPSKRMKLAPKFDNESDFD